MKPPPRPSDTAHAGAWSTRRTKPASRANGALRSCGACPRTRHPRQRPGLRPGRLHVCIDGQSHFLFCCFARTRSRGGRCRHIPPKASPLPRLPPLLLRHVVSNVTIRGARAALSLSLRLFGGCGRREVAAATSPQKCYPGSCQPETCVHGRHLRCPDVRSHLLSLPPRCTSRCPTLRVTSTAYEMRPLFRYREGRVRARAGGRRRTGASAWGILLDTFCRA